MDKYINAQTENMVKTYIDSKNHLRLIEIEFLNASKILNEGKKGQFIRKLLFFMENSKQHMTFDLKQKVFFKKQKEEELNLILRKKNLKEFENVLLEIQKKVSLSDLKIERLLSFFINLIKLFCNDTKIIEMFNEKSLKIKFNENIKKSTNYLFLIINIISIYFGTDKVDQLLEQSTINHRIVISRKIDQKYQPLFKKCNHKCTHCNGNCILYENHDGDHSFYHVPSINEGERDFFFCFSEEILSDSKNDGTKDIRSSLFWTWMFLHYQDSIRDFYGLSHPIFDKNKLSTEQIKIMNLTEDELIDML